MYRYKKYFLIVFITAFLIGITVWGLCGSSGKMQVVNVVVYSKDGTSSIKPWYDSESGRYYYFLPSYAELGDISFDISDESQLFLNNKLISEETRLAECTENVEYKLLLKNIGVTQTIVFIKSANIATMYINTIPSAIEAVLKNKDHKELVEISVVSNNGKIDYTSSEAYIKGRGNVTWKLDKKPFAITLNDQESILNMRKSSKWVLLADSLDNSKLRNKTVLDFAKELGLAETSDSEYVDLYINGEYYGMYLLCQNAETWYERCNQDKNEVFLFKTQIFERYDDTNRPYLIQNGEVLLDGCLPQKLLIGEEGAIRGYIDTLDKAITEGNNNLLSQILDYESWIKKYLIDEVFENYDAGLGSSYFYTAGCDENAVAYAGPIWDYDVCIGNTQCFSGATNNPKALYARNAYRRDNEKILWYSYLYENYTFYNKLVEIYEKEAEPLLEGIGEKISRTSAFIDSARRCNNIRWQCENDSNGEAQYLIDYLAERKSFLDSLWIAGDDYCVVTYYRAGEHPLYRWCYVKKGDAISSKEEYRKWFNDSKEWIDKTTGEHVDFNQPINADISIYYNEENVSESKLKIIRENIEMIVILCSVISLPILFIVLNLIADRRKR